MASLIPSSNTRASYTIRLFLENRKNSRALSQLLENALVAPTMFPLWVFRPEGQNSSADTVA